MWNKSYLKVPLKPCPFCGGSNLADDIDDWGGNAICCYDCKIFGPSGDHADSEELSDEEWTTVEHNLAAEKWNQRNGT